MKQSYPDSNTWPYLIAVLALLAFALAPPARWSMIVLDVYRDATALVNKLPREGHPEPTEPAVVSERVVVAFDPGQSEQVATEVLTPTKSDSAPVTVPVPESVLVPVSVPVPVDKDSLTREVPRQVNPPAVSLATASPTEPSVDRNAKQVSPEPRYVWQPPAGWQPSLIQPLPNNGTNSNTVASNTAASNTEADAETTSKAKTLANLLMPSPIEPPVANRVARLPRTDRDRTLIDLNPSTVQSPTPSLHESYSSQANPDPQELQPQDPQPSDLQDLQSDLQIPDSAEIATEHTPPQIEETPSENEIASNQFGSDSWPQSPVLAKLLVEASQDEVLREWASRIDSELKLLYGNRVKGTNGQLRGLAKLRQLASMNIDRNRITEWHRVKHGQIRYALQRRLDVWQPLMRVAYSEPSSFATYRAQKSLRSTAGKLATTLSSGSQADAMWVDYLALPTLQRLLSDKVGSRKLAETVLARMHAPTLSAEQRRFLQSPTFRALESNLRTLTAKSVHPSEMMTALEAYEADPNRNTANDLILLMQRWRSAPNSTDYRPAIDMITSHYRNANLRIAVTEDLLNKFVPAYKQYAERVNDNILGATVTGRSSTYSNLGIELIPDETGIRIGMLASGNVRSNTASRKGPVTAFTRGNSSFAAGKELLLRPNGVFTSPTETRAMSGNQLLGIQTEWDDVPFVGWYIRGLAEDEIKEQRRQVEAQMDQRIRRQAQQRMDRELDSRVANAGKRLDEKVVQPLRQLRLDPRTMEMRTTEDRAIIRTRLASAWQFAAHTPRPQIRADSKLSLQMHQSAMNNMIEQLQLQGQRMTLEQLMQVFSRRFGIPLQVVDEDHKSILLEFADHPLEVNFDDGEIEVTIHFAELQRENRRWKNFSIRGSYRADVRQLDIELHRQDGIELIGERIGLRDQLALRTIAAKVFGEYRRFEVLRNVVQQQPQLSNLTVTQFTIRDGWLAVAFGENRGLAPMADRSTTTWR